MTPPVRFGILGCGRVAHTHVEAISALGDAAEVVALCDNCSDKLDSFKPESEAKRFSDLKEMLAIPDLDVVSICTPSGMHADHAVLVAKAGKHVMVEKPMDVTVDAVDRMIAACEEAGVSLFPIFQNRFNPTVELVKEAIELGRFGQIFSVNSTVIWKRGQSYYDADSWRGTRAMDGGAYMNQGIHFVDMMRYLGGEIEEVVPMLGHQQRDIESEDCGSVLFRFENGALGNSFVTMLGASDVEGSVTIIGEKGMATLGGVAMNTIEAWEFDTPHPEQDEKAASPQTGIQSVYGNGHQAAYHKVVQHLREGQPYPITPTDAKKTVELIVRCYQG